VLVRGRVLTQLDHERRKLVELHYRDAIPPDLFEDEAALAQEAKDPPSNTETRGPTSTSEPHTQDVKVRMRRLWWA
jgi:hypothetical protein